MLRDADISQLPLETCIELFQQFGSMVTRRMLCMTGMLVDDIASANLYPTNPYHMLQRCGRHTPDPVKVVTPATCASELCRVNWYIHWLSVTVCPTKQECRVNGCC